MGPNELFAAKPPSTGVIPAFNDARSLLSYLGLQPGEQKCYIDSEQQTNCRSQQLVEPLTPDNGRRDRSRAKRKLKRAINKIGQMPMKRQIL